MFLNSLMESKTAMEYCQCLLALQRCNLKIFVKFLRYCDNLEGIGSKDVYANVDVSLTDVLLNSQACSSRAAVHFQLILSIQPLSGCIRSLESRN